ncbi:EAL domain-containing protein [Roseobacter sp.]|uniref:putative bifunctional diguanylate cyclase/phosphodiesterase n=1 Tax=Roseobacter sp. TaxID=1907202 RepID=UPI003298E066
MQRRTKSKSGPTGTHGSGSVQIDVYRLGQVFNDWPHAIFVLNQSGRHVYQNPTDRGSVGDLDGKFVTDIAADFAKSEDWGARQDRVLAGETVTHTVSRGDRHGGTRDADITMSPLRRDNVIIGILGMTIDQTHAFELQRERKEIAKRATAASNRLKYLTDNVPGGIFEYVIDSNGTPKFTYINSGMGPLLGTTKQMLLQNPAAAFQNDHPDDAVRVQQAIARSTTTNEPLNITHRLLHPERGLQWNRLHATPTVQPNGDVIWHGYIFDVTEEHARAEELEQARNRMEALSLIDSLTGLPNHRACDEAMAKRWADPQARCQTTTVVRIDLDHFKSVNDTLGHAAGDAVLCRVGDCLNTTLEPFDFTARLGGDEFVIVLAPGKTESDAEDTLRKLRALIEVPFMFEGRHCHFDASFGIASVTSLPSDYTEVLSSADAALFQAKRLGRGRMAVFTPSLKQEITHRRRRAGQIRTALDQRQFVPFFQPQIDAITGEVAGFEVLARWPHPTEGCIPPLDFIPIAEQMRVVHEIDRMMFEKAIEALGRFKADGLVIPKLAFNVSAARVHDPDIIKSVKALQTGGTRVAFELLESILLEDETALFAHHIDLLKECGIEIEVDDFGSGRASIIGVLKVAPDTIKIDGRLIRPLFESEQARGLLRAIVDIGHSLNIDITAEGVETIEHARALRSMGCKTLQGFAFARPMPEANLKSYLAGFSPAFMDEAPAKISR